MDAETGNLLAEPKRVMPKFASGPSSLGVYPCILKNAFRYNSIAW
jgi:hypothetical protein